MKVQIIKFNKPSPDFHKQQWFQKNLSLEPPISQSHERILFFSPQFVFQPAKLHGLNKTKKNYQGGLSKTRTPYLRWRGHYIMAQYCQRIYMTWWTRMVDKPSHIINWRSIKGCLNALYQYGKFIKLVMQCTKKVIYIGLFTTSDMLTQVPMFVLYDY